MKVFKYSLHLTERQTIEMPANANILHVKEQNGNLCIWAEVDTHDTNGSRTFRIVGTGHDVPSCRAKYIGTCFMGSFVWHIYEEI